LSENAGDLENAGLELAAAINVPLRVGATVSCLWVILPAKSP
jgi:hypothetical protein